MCSVWKCGNQIYSVPDKHRWLIISNSFLLPPHPLELTDSSDTLLPYVRREENLFHFGKRCAIRLIARIVYLTSFCKRFLSVLCLIFSFGIFFIFLNKLTMLKESSIFLTRVYLWVQIHTRVCSKAIQWLFKIWWYTIYWSLFNCYHSTFNYCDEAVKR